MNRHPLEFDLALYAGGDLSGWQKMRTAMHVRRCDRCHAMVEALREDRYELADAADAMPPGLDWEQLSAEMAANIHLGLEAGECVSTAADVKRPLGLMTGWDWRPAAAMAGLTVVFCVAWWLNMGRDMDVLAKVFQGIFKGQVAVEHGPVVAASADGAELRENGDVLEVGVGDAKHVSSTVSFDGSASTRYFDDGNNFQMTIAVVSTR
jgi:hypothetical protein